MNIILYKTATCPKCKVVKAKLDNKDLKYTEEMDVAAIGARGVTEIPTLEVDGELITDFRTMCRWVDAQEVSNG
jgi:glutaredoxin